MANRDHSIDPVLLKSAQEQFMQKGFSGASLQEICKNAGVTTGAVYIRYRNKEALFEAVVQDAVDLLDRIVHSAVPDPATLTDRALLKPWYAAAEEIAQFFAMFDSVREPFTLLLTCSDGTKYCNFPHDFADRMTDVDYPYLLEAQRRGLASEPVTRAELHNLMTAYWSLFYEPYIHGMSGDALAQHCRIIEKLFDWRSALGLPERLPD